MESSLFETPGSIPAATSPSRKGLETVALADYPWDQLRLNGVGQGA